MPRSRLFLSGVAAVVLLAGIRISFAAPRAPVYLGVLEGPQVEATAPNPPVSSGVHVRVLFRRDGSGWKPMEGAFGTPAAIGGTNRLAPQSVAWTVFFRGKAIGHVGSRNPGVVRWYSDVGAQVITTPEVNIPVIRSGARDFPAPGAVARRRPLLLVSAPQERNRRAWRPTVLTPAQAATAAAALRTRVHSSERCRTPEQGPVRRVPYGNDRIHVLRAYRDRNGQVLLGERLEDPRANCAFFDDPNFVDYWFVMGRRGSIRYLGRRMTPVDVANVDPGGRPAWLFLTSRGEDEYGYRLFYDDFRKVASFHWIDH